MSVKEKSKALMAASVALYGCDLEELKSVANQLRGMGCEVRTANTSAELERLLSEQKIDAIVAQLCPSEAELLGIMKRAGLPPVIPLLRQADESMYMDLLRRGAFDCVPLPSQEKELRRVLYLAVTGDSKRVAGMGAG